MHACARIGNTRARSRSERNTHFSTYISVPEFGVQSIAILHHTASTVCHHYTWYFPASQFVHLSSDSLLGPTVQVAYGYWYYKLLHTTLRRILEHLVTTPGLLHSFRKGRQLAVTLIAPAPNASRGRIILGLFHARQRGLTRLRSPSVTPCQETGLILGGRRRDARKTKL